MMQFAVVAKYGGWVGLTTLPNNYEQQALAADALWCMTGAS